MSVGPISAALLTYVLRLTAPQLPAAQIPGCDPAICDTADVAANPARPTVATPATLTPIGYLQFENGVLDSFTSGEFETRFSINQVTKLTVHKRVQLLLLMEPVVWSHDAGLPFEVHAGGVGLGAQVMLRRGKNASPTISVSYVKGVYSGGAPDLDVGSPNQSFLLLVSNDMAGFHMDANAIFNDETDGGHHAQYAQTVSVSHPLGSIAVVGELWHYTQPLVPGDAVGTLWAISYAPTKILVVDIGFDKGLTSTSTRFEIFAGFTYLLPHKLWR
jgi:hypothetical protein